YFVFRVALGPFGAVIPARDDARRIEHVQGIVGDAGHQCTELLVALPQVLGRLFLGRSMPTRHVDEPVIRGHGPGNPSPRSVAMAETVFDAHVLRTSRE